MIEDPLFCIESTENGNPKICRTFPRRFVFFKSTLCYPFLILLKPEIAACERMVLLWTLSAFEQEQESYEDMEREIKSYPGNY